MEQALSDSPRANYGPSASQLGANYGPTTGHQGATYNDNEEVKRGRDEEEEWENLPGNNKKTTKRKPRGCRCPPAHHVFIRDCLSLDATGQHAWAQQENPFLELWNGHNYANPGELLRLIAERSASDCLGGSWPAGKPSRLKSMGRVS